MDSIIDLAAWRRRHEDLESMAGPTGLSETDPEDPGVLRLEHAIQRLHGLVSFALDARGRLETKVETELLAIMGELTVGLVNDAATRAERLADRLAVVKGGRRT